MIDNKTLMRNIRIRFSQEDERGSELLDGARCEFDEENYHIHDEFGNGIEEGKIRTLYIYMLFEKYSEVMFSEKEYIKYIEWTILDYANNIVSNDDKFDTIKLKPSKFSNNIFSNSIFGEPSTDSQFQCDIFVIMPFSDEFETIYEHYITPCAQELGLTVKLGKDPFSGKDIVHDIWSLLNTCRLVIADCTNRNPNVFYELGMAHTLDKRVIMLTRDAKDLPFDVAGKRAIEYQYDPAKLPKLKSELKEAIKKILSMPS